MIPWDKFKTPQDAYEWAKGAAGVMVLISPRAITRDHLVLKLNPATMAWHQEALCCRGCIVTTHEVEQALATIRGRR